MHFAFIFGWDGRIPPTADNVKAYFVSKELVKRRQRVTWIRLLQNNSCYTTEDNIEVKDLRPLRLVKLRMPSFLIKVFSSCLKEKVMLVYLDCWFLTRSRVHLLLFFQALVKAAGIKLLYDARDPFPEYEIACGNLKEDTLKVTFFRVLMRLFYKQSDMILTSSKEYKEYLVRTYAVHPGKIHAVYHGADSKTFNLGANGQKAKMMLGLCDKIVIGWFGVMTRVRQVEQILVPLVPMADHMKTGFVFLFGGKGMLKGHFERLVSSRASANVSYLGYVPYNKLANHVAACDITLCPLDSSSVHGRYGLSRKISESLSVGVPVIATTTPAVKGYFGRFKSVKMVDNTPEAFMEAIVEVIKSIEEYKSAAKAEAVSPKLSLQASSKLIADLLISCF
ncbi:MAG: glycosyltransferase [Candidatus Brockarchaeota archaeon]|nr:glycosyltransferase [Candidatus Brockarchaeota archaeon]